MRIVYFGTPDDAVPALRALAAEHDIAFVVTQPDRRRSRRGHDTPSPVKVAAGELGLEVMTPVRAGEIVEEVSASGAELGVVVAYGRLLPVELLDATPSGFVNVHFSLLPRWRGAAPVERAILAGDDETAVCIMAMEEGLDTGGVYATRVVRIGTRETAGELRSRLSEEGADLLLATLPGIAGAIPEPQQGEPTYAAKLDAETFALDWSRPANELDRVVRAGNPRPGAWTAFKDPAHFEAEGAERLKILRVEPVESLEAGETAQVPPGTRVGDVVATGDGALRLVEVQPAGKRTMAADAWVRGLARPTDRGA